MPKEKGKEKSKRTALSGTFKGFQETGHELFSGNETAVSSGNGPYK